MSNVSVSRRMNLAAMLGVMGVSLPQVVDSLPKHPKPVRGRTVHSGGTFNAGRNAEKRAARAEAKVERAIQVRIYRESEIGPRRAPKNNCAAMIDMLSNRRLRQRGVAA